MKIICQTCQSKYTVSDEKVQGKTVKIKCRKCGATIMVNSSGASQQNGGVSEAESFSGASPAVADGDGGAGTYTVNVADGDQRTMTLQEVVEAYNESVINAETYIWADGQSDWLPLGQIDTIVNALHAGAGGGGQPVAAAPEPSAPMAAAPMAQPSLGSHMPDPLSSPGASVPRAARREVGRGGRDLFGAGGFGGGATQAAADDVATSAPLFSAGMHQPPPSTAGGGAAAGQRDENSVLFSLSALTAKAGPAAPSSQTTATKDDSGLIDLRALSAGASAPAATSNLVPDNAALFPLGVPAAPPMAAPILGLPSEAPKKNNTPIFIGLGLVIALVAVFGTFMVMKGGEEPVAPPVAATTAAAPPPVEPPPTPTAEASAAPTASASASASATAVAAAPRPRGGGGGVKTPPKETGSKAGSSGGATPPAKTPPKSNCNCPPGDLMCAMKCSTK